MEEAWGASHAQGPQRPVLMAAAQDGQSARSPGAPAPTKPRGCVEAHVWLLLAGRKLPPLWATQITTPHHACERLPLGCLSPGEQLQAVCSKA